MVDGTCQNCLIYTRASVDGKSCEQESCTNLQKLMDDGTCSACGPHTRATSDGKGCAAD